MCTVSVVLYNGTSCSFSKRSLKPKIISINMFVLVYVFFNMHIQVDLCPKIPTRMAKRFKRCGGFTLLRRVGSY